jgi:hypothetical protein
MIVRRAAGILIAFLPIAGLTSSEKACGATITYTMI